MPLFGRKIVTLDFDGRDIRLLVVQGKRATCWATVSVSPELMQQGLIQESERMGAGLARFLSVNKASRRNVVSSVTGHRSVSRLLTLPQIKPELLDDAVRRKAKQEMPLPLDETYLSWEIVRQEEERILVYALAVPRLVIDRQVEAMRAAKIKPVVMDLKPLALIRAVQQRDGIIVNLEEQGIGVIIVIEGVPVIVRSMPQGNGKPNEAAVIDRLSLELTRTVQFYNDSHRDHPLDPRMTVYLTGAPFDDPKSIELLTSKVSFPVQLPEPPMRLPEGFPIATYAANLGLAMKKV
jgi:type IV pilus assembly protein PilM